MGAGSWISGVLGFFTSIWDLSYTQKPLKYLRGYHEGEDSRRPDKTQACRPCQTSPLSGPLLLFAGCLPQGSFQHSEGKWSQKKPHAKCFWTLPLFSDFCSCVVDRIKHLPLKLKKKKRRRKKKEKKKTQTVLQKHPGLFKYEYF